MDIDLAKTIIAAVENNGEGAVLISDYSGTHGVEVDVGIGTVMAAIINNADLFVYEDGEPLFGKFIESIRSDSMGLGNILY